MTSPPPSTPDAYPPMAGFLTVRFRIGDSEIIELDSGSTDTWFAVKMLRAAADALGEWAEAQEVRHA